MNFKRYIWNARIYPTHILKDIILNNTEIQEIWELTSQMRNHFEGPIQA